MSMNNLISSFCVTPKRGGGFQTAPLSKDNQESIIDAIELFDWDNIIFGSNECPIIEIRNGIINGDVEIKTDISLDIWIDKHLGAENQPNNKEDRRAIEMLFKHRTNKILWYLYWTEVKRSWYCIVYKPDTEELQAEIDPNDEYDALREFKSIVGELKPIDLR